MTKSVVNDWVVELGWDDSKVLAGQKKLSKIMAKVERIEAVGQGKATRAMATQERSLQKQNTLEAKRLSLVRSINRAKALGVDVTGFASSARGSNPLRVDQRRLELERMITKEKEKQRVAASKVGAAPAQRSAFVGPRTPKDFLSLDSTAQLKMGQSIDAVVRGAARGLSETSKEFAQVTARANQLKATIGQVNSKSSLQNLRNELVKLRETTNQYTASARKANSAMTAQKFAANGMKASVLNLARSYVSVFAAMQAGQAFFRIGKGFENMEATMLMTSGTTEQAAADMQFLTDMSRRLGIQVLDTAQSFAKYGIAASSAGLNQDETRKTFEDMAVAIRATGLSQDKANLSFLAMQQMLSNGVVSMQELKLQLSEQLPQTMGIAEKALRNLGHTSGSVKDIISTGSVESGSFVKELTRLMKEQAMVSGAYAKSINSVEAAQARLNTSLQLSVKGGFDTGKGGMVFFMNQLSVAATGLAPLFRVIGRLLNQSGRFVGHLLRLWTAMTRPIFIIGEVLQNVWSGILGIDKATGRWEQSLSPIARLFQFILGVIQLIPGVMERASNVYEHLRGDEAGNKNKSAWQQTDEFLGTVSESLLNSLGMSIRQNGSDWKGQSMVNSNNTLTVQMSGVDPANSQAVKEAVQTAWQDMMRVGQ